MTTEPSFQNRRILVTGSRTWTDRTAIRAVLFRLAKHYAGDSITVVHGGARGADAIAGEEAAKLDLWVEVFPADWKKHGPKRAGFIRNQAMVDSGADVCVAFIEKDSAGASMCADLAEQAGIKTLRLRR